MLEGFWRLPQVNETIRTETYSAYEVIFIGSEDAGQADEVYDHDTVVHSRLITHLHNFFAIHIVYFDNDWDNAVANITYLHSLTYTLTIIFEEDIAIVHLHIRTLDEMKDILGLDEEQREFLLYIIENRNLYEFFPNLGDYFFGEILHAVRPEEIAYILDNVPISWPTTSRNITSGFGNRPNPFAPTGVEFHNGIDIGIPIGTPIFATVGGRVINSFYSTSGGEMIIIQHELGIITRYLHLDIPSRGGRQVFVGQTVASGDLIGLSGNTGRSTGPHLHYDIAINGNFTNPLLLLP